MNQAEKAISPQVMEFWKDFVAYLLPDTPKDSLTTADVVQIIAQADPEHLQAIRGRLEDFKAYLEDYADEYQEEQKAREREVLRLSYIAACRDLAAPLKRFLNHPWVDQRQAEIISDAVNRIFNADPLATLGTQGDSAARELEEMASGHERSFEPEWARPLGHYIQQALSDPRTPVELHNGLVDACDLVMEPFVGSAADDVRRRFVDCLTKTIAGTKE